MAGVAASERDRLPIHGFTGTPDRAPVVRAGLSRARRQHAPAHVARRRHGLRAGVPRL